MLLLVMYSSCGHCSNANVLFSCFQLEQIHRHPWVVVYVYIAAATTFNQCRLAYYLLTNISCVCDKDAIPNSFQAIIVHLKKFLRKILCVSKFEHLFSDLSGMFTYQKTELTLHNTSVFKHLGVCVIIKKIT